MARSTRLVATGYLRTIFPVARQHAAEILRPWPVHAVLTMTWPTCRARRSCGSGGKPRKASILPSAKAPAVGERVGDPMDVLYRVEPDMGGHHVSIRRRRPQTCNADALALQVGNAADAFVARTVRSSRHARRPNGDRAAGIDCRTHCERKFQREIRLRRASTRYRRRIRAPCIDIADIGKSFRAQQLLGDILRSNADGRACASRTVVVSSGSSAPAPAARAGQPAAPASDRVAEKAASGLRSSALEASLVSCHAFSSRLSSSKKRQSVFSAMILFGVDLIKPAS